MPRSKNFEDRAMRHVFAAQRSYDKAEDILLAQYRRAKLSSKRGDIENSLISLVQLYAIAGWAGKALASLQSLERQFPKSLRARLRSAEFLYSHGGDYPGALEKVREIRMGPKTRRFDYDAYYNALVLKGKILLQLGKAQQAIAVMKELAKFVAAHSDKTIFFMDLEFVAAMIDWKLAIPSCRAYLETINAREQVAHDALQTKELLRKLAKRRK